MVVCIFTPVLTQYDKFISPMRILNTLFALLLIFNIGISQTFLINPNTDGGFQIGATFASNGWTVVNGTLPNKWFLNTVPGGSNFSTRAAYISNDVAGNTWNYTTSSVSVVHFYKDITFPAGQTTINYSFNWQCLGESGSYDALLISIAPTSYLPSASSSNLGTQGLGSPTITIAQYYNSNVLNLASGNISSAIIGNCDSSVTKRVIFTWKNDDTVGNNPPVAIDNISLTSAVSSPQPLPIIQSFTGYTGANLSAVSPGWYEARGQLFPEGNISNWRQNLDLSSAGNVNARVNLWNNLNREWIVLPEILCTNITELSYDFAITDWNNNNADPIAMQNTDDSLSVMITSDCGQTWSRLFSHVEDNTVNSNNIFSKKVISLDTFDGQKVRLAFFATDGSVNNDNDYDLHVDNVIIKNNPTPFSHIDFQPGTCNSSTNRYRIAYKIYMNNLRPSTGYIVVKDNSGINKSYPAPFPETIIDTLNDLNSDGVSHQFEIYFTDSSSFKYDTIYTAPAICNSNPIAYYNPNFILNPNAESGFTSGSMSVSDQGGMIYQIPIQLPPGTAGVKPSLSITYNSNGGDGIMGMGFSCDAMSFISRTGNTFDMDGWNLGVQLSDHDKLSINGERLIQTNASSNLSYLRSGAYYITKNQNFTKYEAVGSANQEPNYFVAYTKSGEKMYFGNSTDSRVVEFNTGKTVFWLLKRVEDQFGNYFEYEYFNRIPNVTIPANEFYPTKIKYTGNSLLTPYCSIDFVYTNRSIPERPVENYSGGILQINTKKLSEIKVSYLDTLIKKYVIAYDSSEISKILRVRSIQEYGMNGKYFQPTVFNWDQNESISNFSESNKITNLISRGALKNVNARYAQPDLNGDGLFDFVSYNLVQDSIYIFLNRDGQFPLFQAIKISSIFGGLTSSQGNATFYIDDIDGNNTSDFVYLEHSTGINKITYTMTDPSRTSIYFEEGGGFANPQDVDNFGSEQAILHINDIDGNGLVEFIVQRKSTGTNYFYTRVVDPNTGNDIYQISDGPLVLPPALTPNVDIKLLDLNSDGNSELIWAERINNQFVLKMNRLLAPITHFFSKTDTLIQYAQIISFPFPFDNGASTSIYNENVYFTELNGDGIPDFAYTLNGIIYFYINSGNLSFKLRGTFTLDSGALPVFADLNNDGKFDFLQFNVANGINNWKLNQGFSSLYGNLLFVSDPGNNSLPSGSIIGCTPRFLSYRKVSFTDVMFINECSNDPGIRGTNYWWINNFKPSFKVNEVINGLGLKNKIVYTTTANQTVYSPYINTEGLLPEIIFITLGNPIYELAKIKPFEYTGRMPVVQEYQIDNGYNGVNRLSYKYQRAIMDRSGAGFRGFERVIIRDETSKIITVKKFGLTTYGILSEFENYTMLEGRSYPINRSYSLDTIHVKNFTNKYSYPGNVAVTHNYESYFQFNQSSQKFNFDLNGDFASYISSFNVVDTFGNVLKNIIDYDDGFVDTLKNTYTNNTSLWHLGRLTRSELKRKSPNGPSITRVTGFEYSPVTGILKREIVEPDLTDTIRIEKFYNHDQFGNVTSERIKFKENGIWKTRGDSILYDVRGRFIVETRNDLGHVSKASYNNFFGHKKSVTDINNITTTTTFDEFGRVRKTDGADDSWNETIYKRCNNDCPVEAATYTIDKNSQGQQEISYFDKMGREVKSETKGFYGAKIFTENKYDLQGRLIATSDPFYANETKRFTTLTYDEIGREIIRSESGGSITSKKYFGLGIEITNPIGQRKRTNTYANGKIKNIKDNQGNVISFQYDAQGNTIKTLLPGGYELVNEYNILNQQTKMTDPDMGVYIYKYNAIGEIKYQKDPKGNEVFMKYDTLGRLKERKELEDISYFVYDVAPNGKGMLSAKGNKLTPTSPSFITHFEYQYDVLSRPVTTIYTAEGDSLEYTLSTTYDNLSRPLKLFYPTINGHQTVVRYEYDTLGYNTKIIDDITNVVYWKLDSLNSQGQMTNWTLGNGFKVKKSFDIDFDWVNEIITKNETNQSVQHLQYDYDFIGNVKWRKDLKHNANEYFTYDNLNRLKQAFVTGYDTLMLNYDVLGNITFKSDVGTYHYNQNNEGPHVLSSIDLLPGKCIPSASTSFVMNSFNKATSITSTYHQITIKYSIDKQRYRQLYYYNNTWIKQKDFILELIEREKTATDERTTIFIKGEDGVIATKYHKKSNDSLFVHYWLKDNLGSLHTVVGQNDSIVEVLAYDAWGNRRFADGRPMQVGVIDTFVNDRGFTGHEHLEFFDLINMNGRIYDAIIGRFTSPDPFIQEPSNLQSYNRFAYVMNNPLAFTDPSGYWGIKSFVRPFKKAVKRVVSAAKNIAKGQISQGLKDLSQAAIYASRGMSGWDGTNELGVKTFGQENWNTIVVTAATIAAATALGPGAGAVATFGQTLMAGAASGFVGGSLGTILAGGDVGSALKAGLKGAAIGAVSAGLTYGVGQMASSVSNGNAFAGYAVKTAGEGVVNGAISEYQGGSFRSAFESGIITSSTTSALNPLTGVFGNSKAGTAMMSAAIGGTASDLSGGKFFNGAASEAMSMMFGPSSNELEEEINQNLFGEDVSIITGPLTQINVPTSFTLQNKMTMLLAKNELNDCTGGGGRSGGISISSGAGIGGARSNAAFQGTTKAFHRANGLQYTKDIKSGFGNESQEKKPKRQNNFNLNPKGKI